MNADTTAGRVVRLVSATRPQDRGPTDQGTGRLDIENGGLVVTETTDDPERAAQLVAAGDADCVVATVSDSVAALAAVRDVTPESPFLAVLPHEEAATVHALLAEARTDVVWADGALLPELVTRRVTTLVTAARAEVLEREREQVDRAIDSLTDLFYIIDADGRMVRWNRGFNEWWDMDDAEIAEMRPWEFLVEDDWAAVQEAIGEVLGEGESSVRVRAALPDGRTAMLELRGRRLTDDDGTLLGLCGTGRDISEQVDREATLRSRNERLDEFAAELSHDLRNPLSVAVASVEIAREERDSPDLERAADALVRLNDIISEVLRTARDNRPVTDAMNVSLGAIAQSAWDAVDTGNAQLDARTDLVIRADPPRLRRLLENLFRNSVEHGSTSSRPGADDSVEHGSTGDHSGDDGDPVTVSVAALVADGDAQPTGFVVADDGPGIPDTDRERVFNRGHSTGDGPGLGLSVVRSLAETHGWRVTLGDAPGASFEFHGVHVVPPVD